jgi:hypothetical protein
MLQNALLMAYSMGKHEEHVFVGSEATKMFFQKYTVWKRAL